MAGGELERIRFLLQQDSTAEPNIEPFFCCFYDLDGYQAPKIMSWILATTERIRALVWIDPPVEPRCTAQNSLRGYWHLKQDYVALAEPPGFGPPAATGRIQHSHSPIRGYRACEFDVMLYYLRGAGGLMPKSFVESAS